MNREIKFRAWDGKYNQMLYGGEIWKRYPNWYPVDYVTNKGVTIWNKRQKNDPENTGEFERLKIFPEISIMEFTGLKDKHGNDIYEGDILKRSREVTPSFVAVIEFKNGMFGGTTKPGNNHFIEMKRLPVCDHGGTGYDEIIGNKFENSELICGN